MSDTLEVFGTEYTNVAGFKATDDNGNTKTYIRPQGTISISANGTGIDVSQYASADVAVPSSSPTIQSLSVTPTESQQTFNASGVDGYKPVTVGAISSNYVGSGITRRSSSDASVDGPFVDFPAGYYENGHYASVSSGTEGTPTASKGTVSNHSVSVTPSVTNLEGWISGSTKTGTPVTVSASELVSGSETKTANGTYDVTNLAELVVNVSGSSKNVQAYLGRAQRTANSYGATDVTLTVAKTGTYNVSWTAWRSSSSGTMGTNLYRNGTAGTNQQTFTGTYGQNITLTNQSYTQGDVLTVYATSGSTSRSIYVANLVIEEQ